MGIRNDMKKLFGLLFCLAAVAAAPDMGLRPASSWVGANILAATNGSQLLSSVGAIPGGTIGTITRIPMTNGTYSFGIPDTMGVRVIKLAGTGLNTALTNATAIPLGISDGTSTLTYGSAAVGSTIIPTWNSFLPMSSFQFTPATIGDGLRANIWIPSGYTILTNGSTPCGLDSYLTPVSAGGSAFGTTVLNSNRVCFNYGPKTRLRRTGTITAVKLYVVGTATRDGIDGIGVQIWRKNGSGTFDMVGETGNLWSLCSAGGGIQTLTLPTPIQNVCAGDYYSVSQTNKAAGTTANVFYGATYTYHTNCYSSSWLGSVSSSGMNWWSDASVVRAADYAVPVQFVISPADMTMIGDSLVAGHPANYTACEGSISAWVTTQDPESTMSYWIARASGLRVQNDGIGSQTSSSIQARFVTDSLASNPRIAVIQGGINDVAGATNAATLTTWLGKMTNMVNSAIASNAVPVVLLMWPWTSGNSDQNAMKVDYNAQLSAWLAVSNPTNCLVVDLTTTLGQNRVGGDPGNLWDIKTAYNADGIHLNAAGYQAAANELWNQIQTYLISTRSYLW